MFTVKLKLLSVLNYPLYPVNAEVPRLVLRVISRICDKIEIIFAEHYRRRLQLSDDLASVHFQIRHRNDLFAVNALHKPPKIVYHAVAVRPDLVIMIYLPADHLVKKLAVIGSGELFQL